MPTPKPSAPKRKLADSLQYIKGVGPKRVLLFSRMGLHTAGDGLTFLPHRYEDRSQVKPIGEIMGGEQVTFCGKVFNTGTYRMGRRRKVFEVIIEDETGTLRAKWFQFKESYMKNKFPVGSHVILSGKPRANNYTGSGLEIIHPDVEFVGNEPPGQLEIGRIVPVYPATEGLHQKSIRAIMQRLVEDYSPLLEEFIPDEVMKRSQLLPRIQAYQEAHFPPPGTSATSLEKFQSPAQTRLVFEELFTIQVGLACKRKHNSEQETGQPLTTRGPLIQKFVKLLPFELTGAQKNVLGNIMHDLEQKRPMNRLVHGDVGSGKTIVALTTLLTAVDNGKQGAMMAPTELLAEQHFLNLKPYCEALGIQLDLITSALPPAEKKAVQASIREGRTQIAVGTHALIQKDVEFPDLGLAVIDEQHRFGVLQREAIGKKGESPHVLIMTATPIPRSLALTLYGDMDISLLDEMPPGRQRIVTKRYDEAKRDTAYNRIGKQIKAGRQAYVVCPLIEESETMDLKTATDVHKDLQQRFPDLNVGLIHGRIKKDQRQALMAEFKSGTIHILVATTVIEVGIDVPNASIMLIEHAERFGLAQLHQLRGRVGRGEYESECLLITYPPLTDDGKLRIEAMVESDDGFVIAEQDLKIRGPGDFMGTRQSGMPSLRFADLVRDIKIIEAARKEAFRLVDEDPLLRDPKHLPLKQTVTRLLGEGLDLLNIL